MFEYSVMLDMYVVEGQVKLTAPMYAGLGQTDHTHV